ncbi:MAG: peptide deformylase [Lysobacterales bacterium]
MAQRPILEHPNPLLREHSKPVTVFDHSVASLVEDLRDTLYATTGIGLCAPQIGDLRGVLVMDLSDDHSDLNVFINPRIESSEVPGVVEESCLSVPGVVGRVVRATEIDVVASDVSGKTFKTHLSGMEAVCLQHEMDHLGGRLFVDHLSFFKRLILRATGRYVPGAAPSKRAA